MIMSCFFRTTKWYQYFLPQCCNAHSFFLSTAPSAFIENVHTPCANGREVSRLNEPSSWRPQLTTITVSKKRNWLQQSSQAKNHCTKEELQGMLGVEEEGTQPPPPPSPSLDHLRPAGGALPRPVRLQLPQVSFSLQGVWQFGGCF